MKNLISAFVFMFLLVGCGSESFTVADDGLGGAPSETGGSAVVGSGGDASGGAAPGGGAATGGAIVSTGGDVGSTGGAATGGSGSAPNALGLSWSDVALICQSQDSVGWDGWSWGSCSSFPELSGFTASKTNVVFTMPARTHTQSGCVVQGMKALWYCGLTEGCANSPAETSGSGWTQLYLCKD